MLNKEGLKKAGNKVYLVAVYLLGITIGGVFTPDVINYAKEINAQQIEQPQLKQKPKPVKKKYSQTKRLS